MTWEFCVLTQLLPFGAMSVLRSQVPLVSSRTVEMLCKHSANGRLRVLISGLRVDEAPSRFNLGLPWPHPLAARLSLPSAVRNPNARTALWEC